jgi:hypothetical protein
VHFKLTPILRGDGNCRTITAEALSDFFTSTGGFGRFGDTHIFQSAIGEGEAFIVEHFASIIRRALTLCKFTGKPDALPFVQQSGCTARMW